MSARNVVVRGRRIVASLAAIVSVAAFIGWSAPPATATVYTSTTTITIPSLGQGSLYPSTIPVPVSGVITDVNVSLTGLYHQIAEDVDVLLVGPSGQDVVLMADAGSGFSIPTVNLTFDDSASGSLPAPIASGTYRPTVVGALDGVAPAPAGPYGSALSVLNGTNESGTWKLFVYDDTSAGTGSISGGWSISITR